MNSRLCLGYLKSRPFDAVALFKRLRGDLYVRIVADFADVADMS
jgi:hypothetical protein